MSGEKNNKGMAGWQWVVGACPAMFLEAPSDSVNRSTHLQGVG